MTNDTNNLTVTKRLALYRHIQYNFDSVFFIEEDENLKEYARISDFVEVTFPMRSEGEITHEKVAVIDEQLNDLMTAIQKLQEQKASLLAITQQN